MKIDRFVRVKSNLIRRQNEMRKWMVLLLVVVLVFVGLNAFGNVNQYETDMAVDALMFPAEKAVNVSVVGGFMNVTYVEPVIVTNKNEGAEVVSVKYPIYCSDTVIVVGSGYDVRGVAERLIFPFMDAIC